jgi:hypothetical protein
VLVHEPGIDVVVCNYRTPNDLYEFVKAFEAVQWEVPCSLHIANVDPLETDIEICKRIVSEIEIGVPVTYSEMKENVGYAVTCNAIAHRLRTMGVERSTIAFFNADTRLRPGVLDACHWELSVTPKLAVIGPKQVNAEGRITHAGIFGTNEEPKLRGWQEVDDGRYDELRLDAVSVAGSAYFVKRLAWDELAACEDYWAAALRHIDKYPLGAFLPTQLFYEETFLSYHARHHGWQVGYHGNVSMVHEWHQSVKANHGPNGAHKFTPTARAQFRSVCDDHGIAHD